MIVRKKVTIWVAVADGGGYRIFSCEKLGGPLKLLKKAQNPEAKKTTGELGTDRPGRMQAAPGQGRHAFQNKADWHDKAEQDFAKGLGDHLAQKYRDGAFDNLLIIAPAKALGRIRDQLPIGEMGDGFRDLDKDLARLKPHELQDYLAKRL